MLDPIEISITAANSRGSRSPGVTSCQACMGGSRSSDCGDGVSVVAAPASRQGTSYSVLSTQYLARRTVVPCTRAPDSPFGRPAYDWALTPPFEDSCHAPSPQF